MYIYIITLMNNIYTANELCTIFHASNVIPNLIIIVNSYPRRLSFSGIFHIYVRCGVYWSVEGLGFCIYNAYLVFAI